MKHNVRLAGKSGAQRQVDVLVEDKVGQYDVRIVLDCRDYKHPVDIKDVEECAGLFEDVSAMRGVIVCPAGFTKNAKVRAQQLQIDLYSPVDTEPHKWQARLKVPAVCDFREARMSFGLATSAPLPFMLPNDFMTTTKVTDAESGEELGTMLAIASAEWDAGKYPTDPGEHARIPILPRKLKMEKRVRHANPGGPHRGIARFQGSLLWPVSSDAPLRISRPHWRRNHHKCLRNWTVVPRRGPQVEASG